MSWFWLSTEYYSFSQEPNGGKGLTTQVSAVDCVRVLIGHSVLGEWKASEGMRERQTSWIKGVTETLKFSSPLFTSSNQSSQIPCFQAFSLFISPSSLNVFSLVLSFTGLFNFPWHFPFQSHDPTLFSRHLPSYKSLFLSFCCWACETKTRRRSTGIISRQAGH